MARKTTLVDYGFRLPAALDNRPLKFEEWQGKIKNTVLVSATPGKWENANSGNFVEQIIRPTGLIDPNIIIVGGGLSNHDALYSKGAEKVILSSLNCDKEITPVVKNSLGDSAGVLGAAILPMQL